MTDYLRFLAAHPRFLAFGMALTAASSFGQTFFIALFGGALRTTFDLSNAAFGSLYAMATLGSAAVLPWVGRFIDRVDLRRYALAVAAGLVLSCWTLASAGSLPVLVLALFGLRLCGQGLMTHTAVTSMARYHEARRGTAISIASLGQPAGEAVLPVLAVTIAAAVGWRTAWVGFGAALAVVMALAIPFLLAGHDERHRRYLAAQAQPAGTSGTTVRSWRRREVLRDPTFHLCLPIVLAPPFIGTGFMFHQVPLVEGKGWDHAWFATTFAAYALASVCATLATGPVLDRIGVRRILPVVLLPLAAGLLALAGTDAAWAAPVFMAGAGMTAGGSAVVAAALWAELYGTLHLGAIRSMATAVMVLSTGLSPALFGAILDAGGTMEAIALASAAAIGVAIALQALPASPVRRLRPS